MADYIGISKPLAIVGITSKPEINYFYGPWENKEEALDNIPQLARIKGLTVGIIEGSEIVEYWFKNDVELVLKLVDPELVYTTDEIQQIINGLANTYVAKEVGKELIPTTALNKLNQLPTKENNDNTYVTKEVGKSLIEDSKIAKLDSLPSSVYSQAETQQIINGLDSKIGTKVNKVTGSRLITEGEATKLGSVVTAQELSDGLATKVDAVQGAGLITDSERISIANAVDSDTLYTELLKKVDKVSGERLITTPEIQKLQNAATVSEITTETDKCVKIDTSEIELVSEDYTNVVLYSRDETQNKLLKIDVSTFISDIKAEADVVYPTYRSLVGTQNGSNMQFKYSGTLIQETAELYIGGLLYPVNIGFSFEGVDTILITGAPIPTSEDIMRLKAIYLT